MTYTLNTDCKKQDGEFIFKINENVINSESVGDRIGICQKDNILWIAYDCDLYNWQVIDFIENLFTSPIRAYNIINIIKYK